MGNGDKLLSGHVVVVSGSTQGIGAGIAKKFAAHGARVIVHGRSLSLEACICHSKERRMKSHEPT